MIIRILFVLLIGTVALSASASPLRHNPFRAPIDISAVSAGGQRGAVSSARPTLIGILLGNDQPLVNLDGKIIGVGEESAGYLLVEVAADHAVFRRGEETITMSLDPGENDE